ncbi:MAG: DUF5694 domain-containing protein [Bacteroidota bacterium]|nr:DUF5694 domain-containing protein [Bacteroidota bacterium]
MKRILLLLGGLLAGLAAPAQTPPADLLLVGTFHFHNPGADLVKTATFDVLAPRPQAELEAITNQIKAYGPQKIFVEWAYDDQPALDTLYREYLGGHYDAYVKHRFPAKRQNFYLRNEIIQLAFRAGKKAGLPRINGLDYNGTSFPYDSVQRAIKAANQQPLQQQIDATFARLTAEQNRKIATLTLTQLLLDTNSPAELDANKGLYIQLLNRAGAPNDFAGPYLVSEWYRRNLYMYSLIQKLTAPTDTRIMVLVGSGHAAMLRDFIRNDPRFRLRQLREVLK